MASQPTSMELPHEGSTRDITPLYANDPKVRQAHQEFLDAQNEVGFFEVDGLNIVATPGVYHPLPESSTLHMLRHLPIFEECRVLEMGTGTGTVGLHCARSGNEVTMTDICPEALRCASFNAVINGQDVELLLADVFDGVPNSKKFDVIIFNIPLLQKPVETSTERIACDPDGKILRRFLFGLAEYLERKGRAYVSYSNLGDLSKLAEWAKEAGLHYEIGTREYLNSDIEAEIFLVEFTRED